MDKMSPRNENCLSCGLDLVVFTIVWDYFCWMFDICVSLLSSNNNCLLGWQKAAHFCSRGAKSHDICRFLSVLWFIYSAHAGNANCQVGLPFLNIMGDNFLFHYLIIVLLFWNLGQRGRRIATLFWSGWMVKTQQIFFTIISMESDFHLLRYFCLSIVVYVLWIVKTFMRRVYFIPNCLSLCIQEETCHMFFTVDIQYTGSIEHSHPSTASSTEQPSCPVCLGTVLELGKRDFSSRIIADFCSNCILIFTYYISPVLE